MINLSATEITDLKDNLSHYDKEQLIELCKLLITRYVMHDSNEYNKELDDTYKHSLNNKNESFATFIKDIQMRFNFPELQKFSVEGEGVFLLLNNSKIRLNGKQEADSPTILPSVKEKGVDFFSNYTLNNNAEKQKSQNTKDDEPSGNLNNRFGSIEYDK